MTAIKTIIAGLIMLGLMCGWVMLMAWIAAAQAQYMKTQTLRCYPRSIGLESMEQQHQEAVQFAGMDKRQLVESWANKLTGAWTVTSTDPDTQLMCVIASGEAWTAFKLRIIGGEM